MTSIKEGASEKQTVVVFGATGPIGTSLVKVLSHDHSHWTIRAVTRGSTSNSNNGSDSTRLSQLDLPNVEIVQGDPLERDSVVSLSKDCSIVYCCIGFHRYETGYWTKHWPLVVENLLAAVGTAKKKLVFCDNLYSLGPGTNKAMDSEPVEPSLKTKPAIRSLLREKFRNHMKEHPGSVTVIAAAEFFGPHITEASFLGDIVTGKLVNGASPMVLFQKDKIHDFCFAPDFARAMAVASTSPEAYDKFWICPHSIHNKTMETIVYDIAEKVQTHRNNNTGESNSTSKGTSITVMPKFVIAILSPFMSFMKEIYQMKEFWTQDYSVDDSHFCKTFGVQATPYEDALQSLVDFYIQQQQPQARK